jgi:hypothetical protein
MDQDDLTPSLASVGVLALLVGLALFVPLLWGSSVLLRYGRITILPVVAIWYGGLLMIRRCRDR